MDSKRNGEELVQIFVDADACPVVGIVEKIAKEHNVPVMLLCDTFEKELKNVLFSCEK